MTSENQQSLTVIEIIDTAGRKPPPPLVIVEGTYVMSDWISPEMDPDTTIIVSAKGFTTNEIDVEFLKHFIKYSDAESQSEWKLLLMNNHESHEISKFAKLANDNHILSYSLISHLTHCMQSLDVGIFQLYKYWHNVTIQDSLAELNIKYNI